jgi:hypothetical protein
MENEEVLEVLVELANGLEALAVQVKQRVKEIVKLKEPVWTPEKIVWQEATGEKGLYHRSEDVNNLEFKAMLRDLNAHNGKMFRDGFFYWVFPNGTSVGRKQK